MKRTTIKLASAVLLFAMLASFVASESKDKYNNPAAENNLAARVYEDIKLGRTDSLFLHLTEIYHKAGWRKYVPGYNEEREPTLIQQDYRVPFSHCSADEITQSRLMDSLSQGWKYWQMWSDSLTKSTWKPAASITSDDEAYLLGNYTILVIMAHELGHFYGNGNSPYESSYGMNENLADHFAMAMLLDLAKADKRLGDLLTKFRKVFMNDIYNSVPQQNRSTLQNGYSLYEHIFFYKVNFGFMEYASMQLVREKVILDLPGLNLRSCLSTYDAGLQQVVSGNKIRMYPGTVERISLGNDSSRFSAEKLEKLNDAVLSYSIRGTGVYPGGELYNWKVEDNVLTLTSLTAEWDDQKIDLTPIKPQLDSIAGFDISSQEYERRISYVFYDTVSFDLFIARTHTNGTQEIVCIKLINKKQVAVSGVIPYTASMQSKIRSMYFTSLSASGPVFICYDEVDRHLILRAEQTKRFAVTEIRHDADFYMTPDLGVDQPIVNADVLYVGVDTAGNQFFSGSDICKYRKGNLLYTVYVKCGTATKGTSLNIKNRAMVWSPKYGFVALGDKPRCAVAIQFK